MNRLIIGTGCNLEAGDTLGWGFWVPGSVGAVIVDHVVYTYPLVSSIFKGIECLVSSAFPPVISA